MSVNGYDGTDLIPYAEKSLVDATPTAGSTRPVSSDGVYDAINDVIELTEDKTNIATRFSIESKTQFDINTPNKFSGFLMIGGYDAPNLATRTYGLYYIRKANTNIGYKPIVAFDKVQSISSSSNTSITVSLTQQSNIQGELFIFNNII